MLSGFKNLGACIEIDSEEATENIRDCCHPLCAGQGVQLGVEESSHIMPSTSDKLAKMGAEKDIGSCFSQNIPMRFAPCW